MPIRLRALLLALAVLQPTALRAQPAPPAPTPSSQAAAEQAVKTWAATHLRDPESARYTFQPLIHTALADGGPRLPAWWICGTLNSRNGFGGMTGPVIFAAVFDVHVRDRVSHLELDDGPAPFVVNWCRQLYRDADR